MDDDGIGLVLYRASELRIKITNCIHRTSANPHLHLEREDDEEILQDKGDPVAAAASGQGNGVDKKVAEEEEEEEENQEVESLLNIQDALESLEAQLSSLQALQQQQWYEKEAALAEIDYSRKKLLKKLSEYKGDDLEVIREATAFAGETVDESSDLLLPPYPSRPSRSLVSDTGYLSHLPSVRKLTQNGVTSGDPTILKKSLHEPERDQVHSESKNSFKGMGALISAAAKTAIVLVGILSVLSLAGLKPGLRKSNTQLKILGLFNLQLTEEKKPTNQCPPGKVPVVENGETRCIVKERVEVPFESVVVTPDVNFGCG